MRFKLGDRVRTTGSVRKDWDSTGNKPIKTIWRESTWAGEGVIVGYRVVKEGETQVDHEGDWWGPSVIIKTFCPSKHIPVWLVAYDLRSKPYRCLDSQVELLTQERSHDG